MGDNHTLFNVQSPNREVVSLAGNFTSGGTGVVTALIGRGFASATRVTTGILLVTLSSGYPAFGYADAHIVGSLTAPNVQLQCSPPVNKSMTITCYSLTSGGNNGAIIDVPNAYQVHVRLDAFNSSVR